MAPSTWQVLKMLAVIILPAILSAQKVGPICCQPSLQTAWAVVSRLPEHVTRTEGLPARAPHQRAACPLSRPKLFQDGHLSSPQAAGTPQEKHQSPSCSLCTYACSLLLHQIVTECWQKKGINLLPPQGKRKELHHRHPGKNCLPTTEQLARAVTREGMAAQGQIRIGHALGETFTAYQRK